MADSGYANINVYDFIVFYTFFHYLFLFEGKYKHSRIYYLLLILLRNGYEL